MPLKSPEAIAHQKAYQRETYRWYRDHGICWKCKTAEAMPMRCYCAACRDQKMREYRERPEIHEQQARSHKARRERLIAAGTCVCCGRRPAMPGFKECGICRKARLESHQVTRIRARMKKESATR